MAARIPSRIAAASAVLALVGGCADDDDDEAATTTETTSPSSTTASAGEELRLDEHDALAIELLGGPDWLAADDSFLYAKLDAGRIDRVDPTGVVVGSVETGENELCQGIGLGFDSVWTCFGPQVVRIGLEPFEEVARIDAEKASIQGHLATGFDRVWVLQRDGSTLVGVDPATNTIGDPIALPARGTDVAVGSDAVWVISYLDNAVLVIDPAGGAVLHRIDGLDEPASISILDGTVWVGDNNAVHRIDEATASIVSSVEGGPGRNGALAADDTGVWVRHEADVRHVDGTSGADTDAFTLPLDGPSPGDMLLAFGALWTSASEHATLFRVTLES